MGYKWKPTYYMSIYFKTINQADMCEIKYVLAVYFEKYIPCQIVPTESGKLKARFKFSSLGSPDHGGIRSISSSCYAPNFTSQHQLHASLRGASCTHGTSPGSNSQAPTLPLPSPPCNSSPGHPSCQGRQTLVVESPLGRIGKRVFPWKRPMHVL